MKHFHLLFAALGLLFTQSVEAQTEPAETVEEISEAPIFAAVEQAPEPKMGMSEYYKFLGKNVKYPEDDKKKNVEGMAYVQFIVERDGRITDVKPVNGLEGRCTEAMMEEALRVIKLSEDWKPGYQKGIPVRVRYRIPINFKLAN